MMEDKDLEAKLAVLSDIKNMMSKMMAGKGSPDAVSIEAHKMQPDSNEMIDKGVHMQGMTGEAGVQEKTSVGKHQEQEVKSANLLADAMNQDTANVLNHNDADVVHEGLETPQEEQLEDATGMEDIDGDTMKARLQARFGKRK